MSRYGHDLDMTSSGDTPQSLIDNLVLENSRIQQQILEHESRYSHHNWGGHKFTIQNNGLSHEKRMDLEVFLRSFATGLEKPRMNTRSDSRRRLVGSSVGARGRMMIAPCRRNIDRFTRRTVSKVKPPRLVPTTSKGYEGDDEEDADI